LVLLKIKIEKTKNRKHMKKYIDVVIQPLAKKDLPQYLKATKVVGKILVELGALRSSDMVLEDEADSTHSFAKTVKCKKGEVLIIATAEFNSKSQRDKIIKKLHDDKRLMKLKMPKTDEGRTFMGGYQVLVDIKSKK
jgi:uncharacterized protein YbaA (DUF1428 family)